MFSKLCGKILFLLLLLTSSALVAQIWTPVGPEGGDARSLAYDPSSPKHIYLGTSSSQLYVSEDGGESWSRWATLGKTLDYVLDHIVIDPSNPGTIYIGAWTVNHEGGAIFISKDHGETWTSVASMEGKSVRALAMAPSDHNVLVAGALDGVYRSLDAGKTWSKISPTNSAEIRNVESIAIDPKNASVIYAGTWHLPWKTEDGGLTWNNIKRGVIDDSDVFSIIVDPRATNTVFASACSGIYKSDNAGANFQKIHGIPYSARRTRVLQLDFGSASTVYAGTTEGLWKTVDLGKTWKRITSGSVVVNDVYVDPGNSSHVLIATDRGGVLASHDGGATFVSSNRGFVHRQVTTLVVDPSDGNNLYAGVINDKEYGGIFVSHDAGLHWSQMNAGLAGRDVFVLKETEQGAFLAGTDQGIVQWRNGVWVDVDMSVMRAVPASAAGGQAGGVSALRSRKTAVRVNDLEAMGNKWYAATAQGIYTSANAGANWEEVPGQGQGDYISLATSAQLIVAATRKSLLVSLDQGENWAAASLPTSVSLILQVAIGDDGRLWMASREGLFRTLDAGDTWDFIWNCPVRNLGGISYDSEMHRLLVTSSASNDFYSTSDGRRWQKVTTGWPVRHIQSNHGRLVATTPFDGVIIEPEAPSVSVEYHLPTQDSSETLPKR